MGNKKSSKTSTNPVITIAITLFISGAAVFLAFIVMLNIFLMTQPPIRNLEEYKPNQVTKIYSADGEIIKTFTA